MPSGGGNSSGGSTTTTNTSTPWVGLQSYLKGGLSNTAQSFGLNSTGGGTLSDSILGSPYPGSVIAPDSAQTTQALNIRDATATGDNTASTAANYSNNVLNGNYLDPSTNPHLAATASAANKQITDSYNNNINPGIDSAAASAGRYGSGAYAALRNQSDTSLANSLGATDAGIYNNAYNTGVGQQQNALTNGTATTQNQYTNSNELASTGDYYTNLGQQQLNANIANYNTVQQQPLTALQTYMNLINGVSDPTSTSSTGNTTNRAASNSLGQTIGTGIGSIASLAALF